MAGKRRRKLDAPPRVVVGTLEPANTLIATLGGDDIAADVCGVGETQVWRWRAPKDRGGTGGLVPQRHHQKILSYAREHGISLPVSLLVPGVGEDAGRG